MTGKLVAIVGPSGVGKDSVMNGMIQTEPRLSLVKRTITRAPGLGGEDYEAVLDDEFDLRAAAGDFCLHWSAHGLQYGVPDTVRARLARGDWMLVNLSRAILVKAQKIFPDLIILNLCASTDVLEKRLLERGRETAEVVAQRLQRATQPLPDSIRAIPVMNNGPLEETVQAALHHIQSEKVS